jgi:hypothetical protein
MTEATIPPPVFFADGPSGSGNLPDERWLLSVGGVHAVRSAAPVISLLLSANESKCRSGYAVQIN